MAVEYSFEHLLPEDVEEGWDWRVTCRKSGAYGYTRVKQTFIDDIGALNATIRFAKQALEVVDEFLASETTRAAQSTING